MHLTAGKQQYCFYFCRQIRVCHCWYLSCQISTETVWWIVIYSLNTLMTALHFKFYAMLYNLCIYCAVINWNFIWDIELHNDVCCNFRNKDSYMNTILAVVVFTIKKEQRKHSSNHKIFFCFFLSWAGVEIFRRHFCSNKRVHDSPSLVPKY